MSPDKITIIVRIGILDQSCAYARFGIGTPQDTRSRGVEGELRDAVLAYIVRSSRRPVRISCAAGLTPTGTKLGLLDRLSAPCPRLIEERPPHSRDCS